MRRIGRAAEAYEPGPQGAAPREEVRATIEEVLARPEFHPDEPSWLDKLLTRFFESIGVESIESLSTLVLWVLGAVGVLLLAWIAWNLVRSMGGVPRSAARGADPVASPAERVRERVRELLDLAAEARAAGDLTRALRLHFFALVVGLGKRGDLEYRDAWTNRELLERGEPNASLRGVLEPWVEELDRKGFGLEPTRSEDVDRLERVCVEWLGGTA